MGKLINVCVDATEKQIQEMKHVIRITNSRVQMAVNVALTREAAVGVTSASIHQVLRVLLLILRVLVWKHGIV